MGMTSVLWAYADGKINITINNADIKLQDFLKNITTFHTFKITEIIISYTAKHIEEMALNFF